MNLRIYILLSATIVVSSCTTSRLTEEVPSELQRTSEWMQHSQEPVPNFFGDQLEKKDVGHGFYEQPGSVASSSSWEAVAHYTYLAYRGIKIGNASGPYSISPSGHFLVIPEVYFHGAKSYQLKIYDKSRNRFVLREIPPQTIRGYKWAEDEASIKVLFATPMQDATISIPRP